MWRSLRRGARGTVSIPNKQAAVVIQSEGQVWRVFRNSTVFQYGAWLLLAVVVVLALFFLIRRRIKIDGGPAGRTVERFNFLERFAHWLAAVSFIILGLTGLNMLYGRAVLIPVMGKDAFAAMTHIFKLAHNYVGYAFIVGIVLMIVIWIRNNLPDKYDIPWLLKGGGLLTKAHPPAKKFNAGQKVIFWSVVVIGGFISASGVILMFPWLSSIQYLQWVQEWHAILALIMIAVIIAHIYIGTLGMQGAFQAMGTGQVDANWAKQHHSVWAADLQEKPAAGGGGE
jgi:formate dehydrogenase subunit gamma